MTDDTGSTSRVHTRAVARLTRLHTAISTGACATVADLAALLECSPRTVKRDIEHLRDRLGAPLCFDRAARRWRYREIGWQPLPFNLSEGELLAFFTAEQALHLTGKTPEARLLRDALAKLAARLPETVSVNIQTLGENLSFGQTPHVGVSPATLRTLALAASTRRSIRFGYYSPHTNERSTRTADVLHLHNFADDWYAISYDHDRRATRDFHAGRITDLRLTDDYFDPPDSWDTNDYLRRGFSMTRGGRLTTVSILFDEYQARWMRERAHFHPDESREEQPDGSLRLTFPVGTNGLEAVARFVCTYAGHCRAEKPAALRNIIRERLTAALAQHEGD